MSIHVPVLPRLSAFAVAALAALVLSGCAGTAPTDAGTRSDAPVTNEQAQARNRALIRLELAIEYFRQGQTTVALDELKLSIAADPTFADAHNLRGLIYMQLNDYRLADESFRRAMQLRSGDGNILHNYAWLLCQQDRFTESFQYFGQAIAAPRYTEAAKSYMAMGICQSRAGLRDEAERSLMRAYELDAGNPVAGMQLAQLFFDRREYPRAQFYIRRINNTEQASAESLWLGMKVERAMGNQEALTQLGLQLKRRFPQSRQAIAFDRGAWNE
ncbi:MAG: type IV pilus biogenesis/stability protein PilW [Burkholderiales bacterium]|jgi:type IV pilus assembly protein PilF|nr:type IV pilus biogenesis/stability protein PilW [Burkholderiales bacterium]